MLGYCFLALVTVVVGTAAFTEKVLVTNDDGWAVAMIRAQVDALNAAEYDVRSL